MKKRILLNQSSLDLIKFASKDQFRSNLQGLHVTENYAEASEGHILIRLPHIQDNSSLKTESEEAMDNVNIIIDREDIKKVEIPSKPSKNSSEVYCLVKRKENFVIVTPKKAITINPVKEEYPETDYFFEPRKDEIKIILDANLLKLIVDYVIKNGDPKKETPNPISLYIYTKENGMHIRFKFKTKDNQIGEGALMPMNPIYEI